MPRDTTRKLAQDPSMVHTEVLRGFNGDVSMDAANAVTGTFGTSGSESVAKFDDLLAFTSANLNLTATANSPTTVSLTANGTVVTNTASPTALATVSTTQVTHTSPLNAPTYSVNVGGGTASGTVTVTRENRL